jgi:Sugar (and other) transporter
MIGALGAGIVADRIGRRPTILLTAVVFVVGVLLAAFSPVIWMLVVARLRRSGEAVAAEGCGTVSARSPPAWSRQFRVSSTPPARSNTDQPEESGASVQRHGGPPRTQHARIGSRLVHGKQENRERQSAADGREYLGGRAGVQARRRFVDEQHIRLGDEGTGDVDPDRRRWRRR